jgi:hypothetical protein
MYQVTQLNDVKVEPIPQKGGGKKAKGHQLFSDPYANIAAFGRKKSGKSSVIFKIVQECATPETTVLAFVSTLNKDQNWVHIQKWCKKKKIPFVGYTTSKGHLGELLEFMRQEGQEDEEEKEQPVMQLPEPEKEQKEEKKRSALLPLDYLLIFDDLGDELRDKYVDQLLKTNRHYRSKVIISSQYIKDLTPPSRKQIDIWLLFGKLSDENLETIFKDADLPIDFEAFQKMYQQATAEKYHFLYVDVRNDDYRIDFNKKIIATDKNAET